MKINPAWIEAGKGPHCDIPSPDLCQLILELTNKHSPILNILMTDQPDSRRTASEINEINSKAHTFHVGIDLAYIAMEPGYRHLDWVEIIQPGDEFLSRSDTWEPCLAAIGKTRAFYEKSRAVRRKITDVGVLHDELKRATDALHLMTAGREQDGVEHREAIAEFQKRLETDHAGLERLKRQRNDARAEAYSLKNLLVTYRQESFPVELENERLKHELECACKQRDGRAEVLEKIILERDAQIANLVANQQVVNADHRKILSKLNEELHARIKAEGSWKTTSQGWRETADGLEREILHLREHLVIANTENAQSTGKHNELIKERENLRVVNQQLNSLIRSLQAEIVKLREFENEPVQIRGLRACVDGKLYTIDDLCKEHSELKTKFQTSVDSYEAWGRAFEAQIRDNEVKFHNALQGEWRRGFNDGTERVMKYVSKFSQEIGASIAQRAQTNQNPS